MFIYNVSDGFVYRCLLTMSLITTANPFSAKKRLQSAMSASRLKATLLVAMHYIDCYTVIDAVAKKCFTWERGLLMLNTEDVS